MDMEVQYPLCLMVSAPTESAYSIGMNGLRILVLIIAALWAASKILKRTNTL